MKLVQFRLRFPIYFFSVFLLSQCGKLDTPISSGGASIPGNPVESTVFSVSVGTIWETDTTNTAENHGECSVTSSSTTCSISVPEAKLYYGKLQIKATVNDKAKCALFTFFPYYYQMSNLADFRPTEANSNFTAIDCSVANTPAGCFSGPATKIAPSFPIDTAVYYLPAANPDLTWTIDSANSIRQTANYNPGLKWVANNLIDINRATTQTDETTQIYIGGSMVDYKFSCYDIYNDLYRDLTITIQPDEGPLGYFHSRWN